MVRNASVTYALMVSLKSKITQNQYLDDIVSDSIRSGLRHVLKLTNRLLPLSPVASRHLIAHCLDFLQGCLVCTAGRPPLAASRII